MRSLEQLFVMDTS